LPACAPQPCANRQAGEADETTGSAGHQHASQHEPGKCLHHIWSAHQPTSTPTDSPVTCTVSVIVLCHPKETNGDEAHNGRNCSHAECYFNSEPWVQRRTLGNARIQQHSDAPSRTPGRTTQCQMRRPHGRAACPAAGWQSRGPAKQFDDGIQALCRFVSMDHQIRWQQASACCLTANVCMGQQYSEMLTGAACIITCSTPTPTPTCAGSTGACCPTVADAWCSNRGNSKWQQARMTDK
jgi:hypothetical protein